MNESPSQPPAEDHPPLLAPARIEFCGTLSYAAGRALMEHRAEQRRRDEIPDTLLLLEHEPVITMGLRATSEELRVSPEDLHEQGIALERTDRGGLATIHAPGQVVGYPILKLPRGMRDLPRLVAEIQEFLAGFLADRFQVHAEGSEKQPGLYVQGEAGQHRKIAALGLAFHGGVTTHGFALNVANDLGLFNRIVPCGQAGMSPARLLDLVPSSVAERLTARGAMQLLANALSLPVVPSHARPRIIRDMVKAWNGDDPESAAELFAREGYFASPKAKPVVGPAALREAFRHYLGGLELRWLEAGRPLSPPAIPPSHNLDGGEFRPWEPPVEGVRQRWLVPFRFQGARAGGPIRSTRGVAEVTTDDGGLVTAWREHYEE